MKEELVQNKFDAIFLLVFGWIFVPIIWFALFSRMAIVDESFTLLGTVVFWSIVGTMTGTTIWATLTIRRENKGEK